MTHSLRVCACVLAAIAAASVLSNDASALEVAPLGSPAPAITRDVGDRLVVHEWGTFTSLHDEEGNAIGGINGDDEPVPKFVNRISDFLLLSPNANIPILAQGAPHSHPDVTMRLETPVIYFYPPRCTKLPMKLDVEVAFPAGWLSEYYPDADVEALGVKGQMEFGPITGETLGRLRWKDLSIGTQASGPETSSKVWLEPRRVQSANVTSATGKSERYLFYRGVGHVDSPVRLSRDPSGRTLVVTADFPAIEDRAISEFVVPKMWLVEVRDDRSTAFRELDGFRVPANSPPHEIARTSARFENAEFGPPQFSKLLSAMRAALIEDGLFDDEADALLNTWKASYFESPGLRLFYLLPRGWTDRALPLKLSSDATIVRTMIGRLEIVTLEHRRLLRKIAAGPASKPSLPAPAAEAAPYKEQADFQAYRQLGRFRNALLLDELERRPTPALRDFVANYGLQGYRAHNADMTQK